MRKWKDNDYRRFVKKVKHVHFVMRTSLATLENSVNDFADNNPEYKILGIRLLAEEKNFIAVITYLCDVAEDLEENSLEPDEASNDFFMGDAADYSDEDDD